MSAPSLSELLAAQPPSRWDGMNNTAHSLISYLAQQGAQKQALQQQISLAQAQAQAQQQAKLQAQQSDPLYQLRMQAINGMKNSPEFGAMLSGQQPQGQQTAPSVTPNVVDPNQGTPRYTMNPNFMFGGNEPFSDNPQYKFNMDVAKQKIESDQKPATQGQETTALYASRLNQSNDVINKMEGFTNHLNAGDMFQAGLPDFANFMKGEDMQSYQQAQRNFLTAVLRRESGAVISPSEFKEGRQQYFPQPGDKAAVLAQKKQNRDLVVQNFIKSSNKAYVPYQDNTGGEKIPTILGNTPPVYKAGETRNINGVNYTRDAQGNWSSQ